MNSEMIEMKIGEKNVYLTGDPASENLFLIPTGDSEPDFAEAVGRAVSELHPGIRRCLATVCVRDWNTELSPWNALAVFGNENFGAGAADTLDYLLHTLLPELEERFSSPKRRIFLCGYSLAGLFALWASFQTDVFAGVAGVSPSVWFPGWEEYSESHGIRCRDVYLSLGDREEKTRNPRLAAVGDAIRRQYAALSARGIGTILEWNPGNHFAEPEKRLARGIAWLESRA